MIGRWRKTRPDRPNPNELTPPEGVPLRLPVASVGVRQGAQIVDVLITGIAWIALVIFLGTSGLASGNTWFAITVLIFFFIRIPYYVLSELVWNGQTLGKRLTSIKVVSYDGGPLTPHALVSRNLMKEAEIFLPGSMLFMLDAEQPVQTAIYVAWIIIAFAVPLMNPKRRRIGDMIAGTYVIHLPQPILFKDMAKEGAVVVEEEFAFLPHQLDHYGAYELQTLEDLLRAQTRTPASRTEAKNRGATLAAVVERIRKKVDYAEAVHPEQHLAFLQAFYNAQRAHLEQRQLFGDRRADKFHGDATP